MSLFAAGETFQHFFEIKLTTGNISPQGSISYFGIDGGIVSHIISLYINAVLAATHIQQ